MWDYDINELKKSKWGKKLILERQINRGIYPSSREKIDLKQVKKHWKELDIDPQRRSFFKFLIWGK